MEVVLPTTQNFQIRPQHYQRLTKKIAGKPEERILSYLMLRSLKQAPQRGPGKNAPAEAGPFTHGELASIALESSEAERRADGAERELMDWKTAAFMEHHLGEEYDALIISTQKFGFFVELVEVFVEGLVPITRLEEDTGERCIYRDRDHAIVGGRGPKARIWRLGDKIRVRADRIDPMRRRVEFALAD
jgi:ribonuclease R